MRITHFLSDLGTPCPYVQKFNVSTTTPNAPIAEMDCSEEFNCPTPESEATTIVGEDVPSVAKEAEESVTKATVTPGAMCGLALGNVATAVTADLQTDYFVIEEIRRHRRDSTSPTLLKLKVRWEGGEETWEPETDLQIDAPLALFAYWDSLAGGRASAMVDKELWHVFNVVSHETKPDGNVYLQVAWVGSPDTSGEPEENVREAASRFVENYWRSVGGRSGTMTRPDEAESFEEDATGVMNKRRHLV